MESEYLRIEEMARKTGLTKRALRYYEDIGLVAPVRTDCGYRLYTGADLDRVTRIKELKDNLGFSLSGVKDILDLEETLKETLAGKTREIDRSVAAVERQIHLLEEKEHTLERAKTRYRNVLTKLRVLADAERRNGAG